MSLNYPTSEASNGEISRKRIDGLLQRAVILLSVALLLPQLPAAFAHSGEWLGCTVGGPCVAPPNPYNSIFVMIIAGGLASFVFLMLPKGSARTRLLSILNMFC